MFHEKLTIYKLLYRSITYKPPKIETQDRFMTKTHTDLTFFTNEENHNLLDRFKATLTDTQLFDVLVGYFRSSGFYQLYSSIESIEKTRILVGLGIDENAYQTINTYHTQTIIDFDSPFSVS